MPSTPEKNAPDDANYLKSVREHYENFPYPPRNPEREITQFNYSYLCALDSMNHYHYAGAKDFSKGFRALVAGGGTGDSTIMLAEQFREMKADIIHLDISEASMKVATERAKIRGLTNITWVHGSLLNVSRLVEGQFDYINCCGVLHHLASPRDGLAALTAVLKNDGVLGLMLYAKYGREGVYQIQNLMKILNRGEENMQRKVDNCKTVLKNLPATSGFKPVEHLFADDIAHGDAGIYDLFLHSQDVAFSVPEIYAFLASCKLTLKHFFFADYPGADNNFYRFESYIKDGSLLSKVGNLSLEEKQAAAELMHGKIVKHFFYAAKAPLPAPRVDDLTQAPIISMVIDKKGYGEICKYVRTCKVGQVVQIKVLQRQIQFTKSTNTDLLLQSMDGNRATEEILKDVLSKYGPAEKRPTNEELFREFKAIYDAFHLKDCMLLRNKSAPAVKSVTELMARMLVSTGRL